MIKIKPLTSICHGTNLPTSYDSKGTKAKQNYI